MRNFPKGSEILMSAINIPDMVQIVREHGLVPVPVDLHLDTMKPDMNILKSVTNSKVSVSILTFRLKPLYVLTFTEFDMTLPILQSTAKSTTSKYLKTVLKVMKAQLGPEIQSAQLQHSPLELSSIILHFQEL